MRDEQLQMIARSLAAITRRAGGEVRLTEAEMREPGAVLMRQDPTTGDIVFEYFASDEEVRAAEAAARAALEYEIATSAATSRRPAT